MLTFNVKAIAGKIPRLTDTVLIALGNTIEHALAADDRDKRKKQPKGWVDGRVESHCYRIEWWSLNLISKTGDAGVLCQEKRRMLGKRGPCLGDLPLIVRTGPVRVSEAVIGDGGKHAESANQNDVTEPGYWSFIVTRPSHPEGIP